jgi:hypothetical protein
MIFNGGKRVKSKKAVVVVMKAKKMKLLKLSC